MNRRRLRPAVIAVAALLLVAGTALAASPTLAPLLTPTPAPLATPTTTASPRPTPTKIHPPAPSASPKAGSDVATDTDAADGTPSPDAAARFVARLADAGITISVADFQALAAKVGVGGAVRACAYAQASGKAPAQIVALVEAGTGWGALAHQLDLSIGPGIGWIMSGGHGGGNGHGQGHAHANGHGPKGSPTP